MLATANAVRDLPEIPNTTNVIGDIGRQSLWVASLVDEYTKLSFAGDLLLYFLLNFKPNDCFSQSELLKSKVAILNHVLIHAKKIAPF